MSRRWTETRPAAGHARAARRCAAGLVALAALALLGACAASGPPAQREANAVEGAGRATAERRSERARAELPDAVRQSFAAALDALEAENWDGAERILEGLAAEHPDYPGPHVNLAMLHAHQGRDAAARAALEAALAADPGHVQANNELGILLRRAGEFAAAEAAYRRALETDPAYAPAHHNLGVLLDLYLRRRHEALEHYERYQELVREPDRTVAAWIVDLRRRLGVAEDGSSRVAREDGA